MWQAGGGCPRFRQRSVLRRRFAGQLARDVQSNGTLCYDADFTPFGGEKALTSTCPQNYKFEGKERDTETGNDDFGARYYSSRFGRWLSSDWSAVQVPVPYANLSNPQTLNLYSMVSDDPESFADLDGHIGAGIGGTTSGTCGNTSPGGEGDCTEDIGGGRLHQKSGMEGGYPLGERARSIHDGRCGGLGPNSRDFPRVRKSREP